MRDHGTPTCPLVARHAELLAEEARLAEAGAGPVAVRAVRAVRARLEDLMRMVDDLRAQGAHIVVQDMEIAAGAPAVPSSLSDRAAGGDAGAAGGAAPRRRGGAARPAPAPSATGRNFDKPRWSAEDEALLLELRRAGTAWPEIAARLGRSVRSCEVRYYKMLKPGHVPPRPLPGGVALRPWSDAETARMQDLVREGLTWPEVAARMERSAIACKGRAGKVPGFEGPQEVRARLREQAKRRAAEALEARGAALRAARAAQPPAPGPARPVPSATPPHDDLNARLDLLQARDGWRNVEDYFAVKGWVLGNRIDDVAALVARSVEDVFLRWQTLLPAPTPASKANLLAALRDRAARGPA